MTNPVAARISISSIGISLTYHLRFALCLIFATQHWNQLRLDSRIFRKYHFYLNCRFWVEIALLGLLLWGPLTIPMMLMHEPAHPCACLFLSLSHLPPHCPCLALLLCHISPYCRPISLPILLRYLIALTAPPPHYPFVKSDAVESILLLYGKSP